MKVYNNDEDYCKTSWGCRPSKDKTCFNQVGEVMERFSNYVGMLIELILIGIMYLIILPFKILYSLGNKLVSR